MNPTLLAAAPTTVQGIQGGHVLGSVTLSGLALASAALLFFATRKADRLKPIHSRDGIGVTGLITGTLWMAAGGSWAAGAAGINSVPASVLGPGSGLGDPGAGGIALVLTALIFLPAWRRTIWPALLGIAAAVTYASAGGVWGTLVNAVRMLVGGVTGSA